MNINELKQMVGESGNIVFFGGDGTSTESVIPDFRSADGLHNSGTNEAKSREAQADSVELNEYSGCKVLVQLLKLILSYQPAK